MRNKRIGIARYRSLHHRYGEAPHAGRYPIEREPGSIHIHHTKWFRWPWQI